jgi:creatinine amidohydrolase/Fe(II)-dependent formamide hydrolase-like protein
VLIAPVVDFGYYPAFLNYPGSQHLRAETFVALLDDIVDGLVRQGARRIAVVNTGVSTEGPLQIAARNALIRHGVRIAVADIRQLGKSTAHLHEQKLGGHGDEHETSLMLAIAPETVRMDLAKPDYGNMLGEPKTVFYRPVVFGGDPDSGPDYSATGVRGDPTLATREKGEAMLAAMIQDLVHGLRALGPELK